MKSISEMFLKKLGSQVIYSFNSTYILPEGKKTSHH